MAMEGVIQSQGGFRKLCCASTWAAALKPLLDGFEKQTPQETPPTDSPDQEMSDNDDGIECDDMDGH